LAAAKKLAIFVFFLPPPSFFYFPEVERGKKKQRFNRWNASLSLSFFCKLVLSAWKSRLSLDRGKQREKSLLSLVRMDLSTKLSNGAVPWSALKDEEDLFGTMCFGRR